MATIGNAAAIYPDVDDHGIAWLRYANGVLGTVEASWVQTGGHGGGFGRSQPLVEHEFMVMALDREDGSVVLVVATLIVVIFWTRPLPPVS